MNSRIIHEFGSKLYKAKTSYEGARRQCDQLKKEVVALEKELDNLKKEKQKHEQQEHTLQLNYNVLIESNKKEKDSLQKDQAELKRLKEIKARLQREKEFSSVDLEKSALQLEDLVNQRIELERQEKAITEKLQQVAQDNNHTSAQFQNTLQSIEDLNAKIKEVKHEMEIMKGLLSQSCNAGSSIMISSQAIQQHQHK